MTAEVDICNAALTRFGKDKIANLSDDQAEARACDANYTILRDALLRAYPWNFATKREALVKEVPVPAFGYSAQFTLPTDFLKMLRTLAALEGLEADYRIENGKLLINDDAVSIQYIAQITDPNKFDALFVDLLAQRLAAEIAYALTTSAALTERMWNIYSAKIQAAFGTDSQENPADEHFQNDWLIARVAGSNFRPPDWG